MSRELMTTIEILLYDHLILNDDKAYNGKRTVVVFLPFTHGTV